MKSIGSLSHTRWECNITLGSFPSIEERCCTRSYVSIMQQNRLGLSQVTMDKLHANGAFPDTRGYPLH